MQETYQGRIMSYPPSATYGRTFLFLFFVLLCGAIQGQRISIEVGEFSSVMMDRKVPVYFLEDTVAMVVFDGFPLDGVNAEIIEGILVIEVPDVVTHSNGTVVVRYRGETGHLSKFPSAEIISYDRCRIIEPPNATKL